MRFGKRILSDRTHGRSRSTAHRTNRLLVETLERRGMLSVTIGSLADQAIEDVNPAEEYVAPGRDFFGCGRFLRWLAGGNEFGDLPYHELGGDRLRPYRFNVLR